jgi:hypothetical protein
LEILDENKDNYSEEDNLRTVSDADLKALARIVSSHKCRFQVETEDLEESVKFYKNLNSFFETSKKTTWNTVLVFTIIGILSLISLGIWNKSGH